MNGKATREGGLLVLSQLLHVFSAKILCGFVFETDCNLANEW